MFGGLPACGLYVRHVNDLTLNNVHLQYTEDFWRLEDDDYGKISWDLSSRRPTPAGPGVPGPAVVMDNVEGVRVNGLYVLASPDGAATLYFINVRDAFLWGTVPSPNTRLFLKLAGEMTQAVRLVANDPAFGAHSVWRAPEVPDSALVLNGNPAHP
mgnify:CR=1 FL=1